MPSLTTGAPRLEADGPVVQVRIAISSALQTSLEKEGQSSARPVAAAAMIDTGAAHSVIQAGLAGQLGLHPIGVVHIATATSEDVECHVYAIRIVFQNQVVVETTVYEAPLRGLSIQCLIGREILAHCVFIYLGQSNQFVLSF